MSSSPVVVGMIAVLGMVFQGLLYGNELVERSFTIEQFEYDTTDPPSCSHEGALDQIACFFGNVARTVGNAFRAVGNFFRVIIGVGALFLNFVTFNVPGAPWFIRVPVGFFFGGSMVWAIAGLVRGGK